MKERPTNELNEAPILDQMREHWQKIAGLMMHKLLKRGESVTITIKDMQQFEADWPSGAIVAMIGEYDRFTLKLVTPQEAERLAKHQQKQGKGSA